MWFEAGFSDCFIGELPQREFILPQNAKWEDYGGCLDYMLNIRIHGLDISPRGMMEWNSDQKATIDDYFKKQFFLLSGKINQEILENRYIRIFSSLGPQYLVCDFDTIGGDFSSYRYRKLELLLGAQAFLFLRNKSRPDKMAKALDHIIIDLRYDRSFSNLAFEEYQASLLVLCFPNLGPDRAQGYLMFGYRSINKHSICRTNYKLIGIRGYIW